MLNQENKMRAVIAIGTTMLIVAALTANQEKSIEPVKEAEKAAQEQPAVASAPAQKTEAAAVKATPRSATITLRSVSDAGEYGTATLLDLGNNKTRITISMINFPKDDTQPANIHGGGCNDLSKEPQYALKPVVKGRSVTELSVGMGALVDTSLQSIRVRTDAVTAGAPYAACGDLR
jgi:hypothetical protein